jgi:thioredoxin-related protein
MQRRIILCILAGFLIIGTLLNLSSKLSLDSHSNINFNWDDNWTTEDNNTPNVKSLPVEPVQIEQLVANSYQEALEMSAEKKMPILIIFHGSQCSHCIRMKREVLPNQKVKSMMMNYIYLSVDTDERAGQRIASKYSLRYIPAFAITNSFEDKLKFKESYMDVDQLVKWLNNPNMFGKQPSKL